MRSSIKLKPLLSYLGLPIILAVLLIMKLGKLDTAVLLQRCVLAVFGYIASVSDIREKKIENNLVLLLLGAWVITVAPQFFFRPSMAIMLCISAGVGFLIAGVVFLTVYLFSHGGLGGGDVKFMAVAGLFLGFNGVLPAMLYGAALAAVTALILVASKRMGKKDSIPLAPFLYTGIILTMLFQ